MYYAKQFYKEVEYAYAVRKMFFGSQDIDINHLQYLPAKLQEFCHIVGVPYEWVYRRSRLRKYVRLRVAFCQYVPQDIGSSQLGRFLNYDHSTIIHYREHLHFEFLKIDSSYRALLDKLRIQYDD